MNKYDKLDFMNMTKDILEEVDSAELDNIANQMHEIINYLVEAEKQYDKVGIR